MVNINGGTALVTGGQRGLGKAFVRELLERGAARVYATARDPRPILAPQGTLVVGVHLGYADTELTAAVTAPKLDPREVARAVVDGVAQNLTEVLVDDASRYFKQAVAGPVEGLSLQAVAAR